MNLNKKMFHIFTLALVLKVSAAVIANAEAPSTLDANRNFPAGDLATGKTVTSSREATSLERIEPASGQTASTVQATMPKGTDQLKAMNKTYMVDFLKAAQAKDLASFYNKHLSSFTHLSPESFAGKYNVYTNLPNDIAAIEASDFSGTGIQEITEKGKYASCKRLLEAESLVVVQIVQDAHKYKVVNRYCETPESDFKLVSFRFGYNE